MEAFTNQDNEPDLTVEKLRTFKGFETVSDKEAQQIVSTIIQFTTIAYEAFKRQE